MSNLVDPAVLVLVDPAILVLAAFVAWCQHRKIAAQKGTLEFLLKYEVDNAEWRKTRDKVRKILKDQLKEVVDPKSESDRNNRYMVGAFLSRYEFIAVAIKYRAMDETIYKTHNGPAYVRTWRTAESYIEERRKAATDRNTRYENFGELAAKWAKELRV